MPQTPVWDAEGAVGSWPAGKPELTGDCQAFGGILRSKLIICRPADPETKGLLERAHDHRERSFLPGRCFGWPGGLSRPSARMTGAGETRRMAVLGCSPTERVAADKAVMLTLLPVAAVTGWLSSTRLARHHYIRLASNDHSVLPAMIGRRIDATPQELTTPGGGG